MLTIVLGYKYLVYYDNVLYYVLDRDSGKIYYAKN